MAAAALGAGWDPAALAAFVGANTAGIRSPAAVLAARLSPAELPAPPGRAWARPPWCGRCDEGTRRQQRADGADAGRCQRCHPLAASGAGETGRTPQVRINRRRSQTAVSGTPASVHAARQSRRRWLWLSCRRCGTWRSCRLLDRAYARPRVPSAGPAERTPAEQMPELKPCGIRSTWPGNDAVGVGADGCAVVAVDHPPGRLRVRDGQQAYLSTAFRCCVVIMGGAQFCAL